MADKITNALQFITLAVCLILAVYITIRNRRRAYALLSLFYGSWLMGDLYWLCSLLIFGETPQISLVSDLNWYASYIFLYMLLRQTAPPEKKKHVLPWIGPVFALGMAFFFMQWGEYLNNLIYAALMGLLLFSATGRLAEPQRPRSHRMISSVVLVFCLIEYALWTASCYLESSSLSEPYYWFDLLLTCTFPLFLPAVRKAVTP